MKTQLLLLGLLCYAGLELPREALSAEEGNPGSKLDIPGAEIR